MTLTESEKKEFLKVHLPYKLELLETHHRYKDEFNTLQIDPLIKDKYSKCALEISFNAGRMFLNFLGIGYDSNRDLLVNYRAKNHDVSILDLDGELTKIETINEEDQNVLKVFYHRANKGSSHITWDRRNVDGWESLDQGVEIIIKLLKNHLPTLFQ